MRSLPLALAAPVAAAGLAVSGLAGSAIAAGKPKIQPPASIAKAGQIVWCSDIEYPPGEFYRGSTPVGSDIDIAAGISKLMGVKAKLKNVVFDSIIAALLTKKCDAVISGMNDTPARRKQVDFVDYLNVGQSLMVKKGNPQHIATLASLSGKRVSVQTGTTNRDFLIATSKKLQKAGKKPIAVVPFPKDTDALAALKATHVDAYFADSPPISYYAKLDPSLQIAGQPINPIPIGIAIRKGYPLRAATRKAITLMYANGTLKKIVAKWGLTRAVVLLKK